MRRWRSEECLPEKEREERDDFRDDQGNNAEHQHLGDEHEWPAWRCGQRRSDRPRAVLGADHERTEDADRKLPDEDADEAGADWIETRLGSRRDQCARVSAVARALTPMPSTTVTPSVHIVDRTVRSFVHSDRRSPEMPYRPARQLLAARGSARDVIEVPLGATWVRETELSGLAYRSGWLLRDL